MAVSYISTCRAQLDREECSVSTCPICLSDFERDDMSYELVCEHVYHSTCLALWSQQSRSCPCCRQPIIVALPQNPVSEVEERNFRVQERLQKLRETYQRRLQNRRDAILRSNRQELQRNSNESIENGGDEESFSTDSSSDDSSLTSSSRTHVVESENDGSTETSSEDESSICDSSSSDAASDNTDELATESFFMCI